MKKRSAFTILELVAAMIVITLILAATLSITKSKLEKVDKYAYYMAYNVSVDIARNIIAQSRYGERCEYAGTEDSDKYDEYGDTLSLLPQKVIAKLANKYPLKKMYAMSNPNFDNNEQFKCPWVSGGLGDGGYANCGGGSIGVGGSRWEPDIGGEVLECQACEYGSGGLCIKVSNYNACICGQQNKIWKDGSCQDPTTDDPTPRSCGACQYLSDSGTCENLPYYDQCMCERKGKVWKDGTCQKPVPATSPTAESLCERIRDMYNISESNCSLDIATYATSIASGDFSSATPHIVLTNGLKMYITTGAVNIDALGPSDDTNIDREDRVGYTVYIDDNGKSGKSKVYSDVFPFYLLISGKVVPAGGNNAAGKASGADSVDHLNFNVFYDTFSTKRAQKMLSRDVDFRTAACMTGYIVSPTYCKKGATVISKNASCTKESDCRFKVNKPLKGLFF